MHRLLSSIVGCAIAVCPHAVSAVPGAVNGAASDQHVSSLLHVTDGPVHRTVFDQVPALRRSNATLNQTLLNDLDAGASVSISLPDRSLVIDVDRVWRDEDRLLLTGGDGDARLTLVARGDHVTGLLRAPAIGTYRLDTRPDGTHQLTELDHARFDGCATDETHAVASEPGGGLAAGGQCDDGSIIDVLVVYTGAARVAAGGIFGIEAEIDLSVALSNEAYTNSGVPFQINLVHTAEVTYDEDGSYSNHLSRLRNTSDEIMDEVHDLRDLYGADLVDLFVTTSGSCGIGYRMTNLSSSFATSGFSVSRWTCAANNLTFPHELGHNMGCCHDHDNGCSNPLFDDSFGHRFTGNSGSLIRTVMSYSPGTRVTEFSNPNELYDGQPTGVPLGQNDPANNAGTISATALTIANFRCAVAACLEDLDGSGDVGFSDILQVIGAWGPCAACPEDVDGSGDVGFGDVLALIGSWGPCS